MPSYVIGNFLVYAVINAFTPGPANILSLNTATNYGWKKGFPLFTGIYAGCYTVQLTCAVFVFGLNTFVPKMLGLMKYVGAAYIFWLAVRIALSRPSESSGEKSASFWTGYALMLVNVKAYMFGLTSLTGYITDYSTSFWVLVLFGAINATVGISAASTWILAGVAMQKFYLRHYRPINIVLGLTLMECVYSLLRV